MAVEDPGDLGRVDQAIRINELRHVADEVGGGEAATSEADDCPADLAEAFWQRVVDFEKAPLTSHFLQLIDAGVELPPHESLTDPELTAKLWEIFHQLARMRVFVSRTDHLSDRELYAHLWEESLREAIPDMPFDENSAWHIDMLGGCSEDDIENSFRYYADDESRREWRTQFPD